MKGSMLMAGIKNNRRTIYTKKIIKEAFLELLSEKELQKITVTDICKRADVNRGTFYNYYTDTIDLFHQIEAQLIEKILPLIKIDSDEELASWLSRLITILKEAQPLSSILTRNYQNSHLIKAIFQEVHEVAIESFATRYHEDDPRLLEYYFTYFVRGVLGTVEEWLINDDGTSADDLSRVLAQVLPSEE